MPQSSITTWLNFSLQQMAAESYFDDIDITNRDQVQVALERGNTAPGANPEVPGATRFTDKLADRFLDTYEIVDQHSNDATGFSATLLRNKNTGEYTLSFRSTEYRNTNQGGDFERDGLDGADGEIKDKGFAFGQLAAMEQYFADLKAGNLSRKGLQGNSVHDSEVESFFSNAANQFNVTGYSLGGHLATVFTELHQDRVLQTYTFNGAGQGHITGPEATEGERIRRMVDIFKAALLDPDTLPEGMSKDDLLYQPAKDQAMANPGWQPFAGNSPLNAYDDPRYAWARRVALIAYGTTGVNLVSLPPPGEVGQEPAFAKITQLFGHADHNDLEYVANSGVHGSATSIFIEDQPNLDGFGGFFDSSGDFGTTHSITLIVDSLALMEAFQAVDPNATQTTLEQIFSASSNQTGSGITIGNDGIAEGNSLENALDALRKVFLGNVAPTNFGRQTGDFGNLAFRNPFYQNIADLTDAVQTAKNGGQAFQITPLTSFNATTLDNAAETDPDFGIAYRYALKELNPFAVLGANLAQTSALYAQHNIGGALELETQGGLLTSQYLKDRAEFLGEKVFVDVADKDVSNGKIHFVDRAAQYEIVTTADPDTVREFVFGSGASELDIMGNSENDQLYGGGGDDTLTGNGGNDYLEGDRGNDILTGGAGFDTYVYRINDNLDTITDSDGQGKILYDTYLVDGGIHRTTDAANTYHGGAQGAMTYVLDGTNLIINNLITVQNFQNGNLGIHLTTAPDTQVPTLQPPSPPSIDFSNSLPERTDYYDLIVTLDNLGVFSGYAHKLTLPTGGQDTYSYEFGPLGSSAFSSVPFQQGEFGGGENGGDPQNGYGYFGYTFWQDNYGFIAADHMFGPDNLPWTPTGDASLDLHLLGGNDIVDGGPGNDQLYGDAGNDTLAGSGGNDRLFGGADDDTLYGDAGDDLLDGGDGNDSLLGGQGNNVLYGGVGNDNESVAGTGNNYLDGGTGNDMLSGSAGNDTLVGGDGADQLYAADGNNYLDGGIGNDTLSGGAGNDTLLGGEGADHLDAGGGDNLLDGGSGADVLTVTGTGDNTLLGGAGEDQLNGGGGNDVLDGGDGNDALTGGAGTNVILFGRDSDQDTVDDAGNAQAIDIIQFAGDVAPENVTVRAGDNLGLVLSILGTTDRITLPGFFAASFSPVVQASFADGTVWGPATLTAMAQNVTGDDAGDSLSGTIRNDRIAGGIRADTLNGGTGTDTLIGGAGNDIYMFNLGDGVDTIQDTAIPGQGNVLSFSAGIGVTDLTLTQDTTRHTLTIQYDTGGDSVQLLNFDPSGVNGSLVAQTLSFADGIQVGLSDLLTVTMGTDGNDVLTTGPEDNGIFAKGGDDVVDAGDGDDFVSGGAGNDTLSGGPGDDVLAGGEGDDTYVLHIGDGVDTIFDMWTTFGFGDNRILFGDGVAQADLTLIQEANTLTITYDAGGDAVQLANFDPRLVNGSLVVSALQFADGSQVAFGEVAGFLFPGEPMGLPHTFTGTDGADVIAGTAGNDVIDARNGDDVVYADAGRDQVLGGGGDDLLNGGDGDDVLIGGPGDDTLIGGAGNDVLTGDNVIPFFPPEIGPPGPGGGPPDPGGPPGPGGGPPAGGRNDLLIGGAGDDRYTFNIGDGVDTIQDAASPGEGNHILFGMGITVTDLTLSQDPFAGTLTINYGSAGDAVLLGNFNPDIPGGLVVQTLQFSNGVALNTADLLAVNQVILGTQDHAELDGTSGNDLIDPHLLNAYGGIDTVFAGAGNDIVLGGNANDHTFVFGEEGNDTLIGGIGADMLSGGDGNDTLYIDVNDISVDGGAGYDTVVVQSGFGVTLNLGLASVEAAYGSNGDDVLTTDGPDAITVSGNGGADLLVGGGGNDYLDGGDGNDTLQGNSGNDTLIGGAGNDTYTFNLGDGVDTILDRADSSEGNRIVFGNRITPANVTFTKDQTAHTLTLTYGYSGDAVQLSRFDPEGVNGSLVVGVVQFANGSTVNLTDLFSPPVVISGTEGADALSGTPGNDTLVGGTGNDTLIGGAGSDTYVFNLGAGVDTIVDTATAGAGNVVVFGAGITPDSLSLGLGSLLLHYGDQGDAIHITNFDPNDALGAHAIDTFQFADGTVLSYSDLIGRGFDLTGTEGNDAITGTNAVDRILGLAGNDVIQSGDGNDMVDGGDGVDTLNGGAGDDSLVGGSGNDSLDGGLGADAMAGGLGDDTYVVDSLGDTVAESPNEGTDVVQSTVSVTLPDNVENLVLTGGDAISGTGNALGNAMTGNSGANLLDGGPGADTMRGGLGDDTYIVDNVGDAVIEAVGEGVDMVQSSIGYTVGDNAENLMLTGSDAINGTGNALNNILLGNSAANVLDGGAGADTLVGGAGDDSYVVDNVGDVVIEVAGEGVDTVQSSLGYTLGANVENLTLTSTTAITGTGNELDNVITGNNAANVLDGGAGADTLAGGTGDDTYVVDNAGDAVVELPGEGTDTVQSAVSFTLPDNVENLMLIGSDAIDGTGNALDNVLVGNGAANVLAGGAGNDTLNGGAGNDTDLYNLGDGLDQITDPSGTDTVAFGAGISFDTTVARLTTAASLTTAHLRLLDADGCEQPDQGMDVALDAGGVSPIERFAFSNGTTFTLSDLLIQTKVTYGTNHDDVIRTGREDDTIYSLNGRDTVFAGSGNDTVFLGNGKEHDDDEHGHDHGSGGDHRDEHNWSPAASSRWWYGNDEDGDHGTNAAFGEGGNDVLHGGNGKDLLDGGCGDDLLDGGNGKDRLIGGDGNDTLLGGNGEDTLDGGAGDDVLDTGKGEDTILFARGDGHDALVGRANNHEDTIRFGAGIAIEHLWFTKGDNDLTVSVLGTSGPSDQIKIVDWYANKKNWVDEFKTADGAELGAKHVERLVQAMAAFAPPALGSDMTLPPDVQQQLAPALAAAWEHGHG